MSREMPFLKVQGRYIVDEKGKKVYLRGVNLGSWLNLEGYFFHGRNFGAHIFQREFARHTSKEQLRYFMSAYRQHFITHRDIRRIKKMGANVVRLPFHYKLIHFEKRWDYLNRAISWCRREKVYLILDLHAAPGAQNPDWHSDSDGRALLWKDKRHQRLLCALWKKIALRYKNEPVIAGFDILNEAVVSDQAKLRRLYRDITLAIRSVDQRHIIFQEANYYGQKLSMLERPKDANTAYSIHFYLPLDFTFNFHPQLKYPGRIAGVRWDKKRVRSVIRGYDSYSRKWNVPIYVGEFGITFRSAKDYGELTYLKDVCQAFAACGFHWTYWSYKAVANSHFPDGIWQYLPDSPWVRRAGPVFGWENFYTLWRKYKKQIIVSWKTSRYTENKYISRILSRYM